MASNWQCPVLSTSSSSKSVNFSSRSLNLLHISKDRRACLPHLCSFMFSVFANMADSRRACRQVPVIHFVLLGALSNGICIEGRGLRRFGRRQLSSVSSPLMLKKGIEPETKTSPASSSRGLTLILHAVLRGEEDGDVVKDRQGDENVVIVLQLFLDDALS
eukprot:768194-Hanusia_phi.AAC.5